MLKVYDLIQELSKCDADAEVVFKTSMELLIDGNAGEITADLRGKMVMTDIHNKDNQVEISLVY